MKVVEITLEENEEKTVPYIWINNPDNEITVKVTLNNNSSLTLLGVFLGTGSNTATFITEVTHRGKNTKSLTMIRAVCLNKSSFVNDGMVRIVKGAKNANGYFQSKILLFDNAKGRSVPSLEIDENEVKAGHGSTIGRPDEDQMFYLRSRGLNEDDAKRLIISGFFDPIIEMIPNNTKESIKNKIVELL